MIQPAENRRGKTPRNRDLAKIHVAKKQLALSDADYRAMLWTVARVKSSADLDAHGRRRVLEHMAARGFKSARPGLDNPTGIRAPLLSKIRAMLADARLPDGYGDAIAKKVAKVDRLEFADVQGLRKVVAALEYRRRRQS